MLISLFAPVLGFLLNRNSNYFLLHFESWGWVFLILNVVISGWFYFATKTNSIDIAVLPSSKNHQLIFTLLPVALLTEAALVFRLTSFLE
jgi:hypothetical protein